MAAAHPLLAIRPATIDDVPLIRQLVAELAAYERLADAAVATDADLREQLFGAHPAAEVLIGEVDGEAAGGDPSSDDYEEGLSDHPDWARFHKKTKEMYRRAQQKLPRYEQYRLSGMSHKEALKEVKIPKTTWEHWEGVGVLEWFGVSA